VHYGRSRSFKVIEISTVGKLMRFSITRPLYIMCYFLPFPRFNDLFVENLQLVGVLPIPVSFEALNRGVLL